MDSKKKDVVKFNWKFLRLKLSERLMPSVIIPVKKGLT